MGLRLLRGGDSLVRSSETRGRKGGSLIRSEIRMKSPSDRPLFLLFLLLVNMVVCQEEDYEEDYSGDYSDEDYSGEDEEDSGDYEYHYE